MAAKDLYWEHDLLWHYLVVINKPVSNPWFEWYKKVYLPALKIPAKVREMLVGSPRDSNPKKAEYTKARIPWNQRNGEWVSFVRPRIPGNPLLACGTLVKAFFSAFMQWHPLEKKVIPRTREGVKEACEDLARKLANANGIPIPVRAECDSRKHYVGIVGCNRAKNEFLCIQSEPRAGTFTGYSGIPTRFLVSVAPNKDGTKLEYCRKRDNTTIYEGQVRTITAYGNYR